MMRVSVLAIGSEILDGRVLDSNSQFIARQLSTIGLSLSHTVVCDDVMPDIIDCLDFLCSRSDHVVVSGGLGPTSDDLTREAICEFAGLALARNSEAYERLKKRFEERGRVYDPGNDKQASFPAGSRIIPNSVGSAEGFVLRKGSATISSLPGVPRELQPMFLEHLFPEIARSVPAEGKICRRSFRLFGMPEALVGRIVASLGLPRNVTVSYRAAFPEIHVVLKGPAREAVDESFERAVAAVGSDFIFARDAELPLPAAVSNLLVERRETLSVAESCTGGMLGMHCTSGAGSSRFFKGGFIVYENELKTALLGVSDRSLQMHGAVSMEVAKEMAVGCRAKAGSSRALSVTGIAGPDGGSSEKPVGTFAVGVASAGDAFSYLHFFPGERTAVRSYACFVALDLLRRSLLNLPAWNYAKQAPFC